MMRFLLVLAFVSCVKAPLPTRVTPKAENKPLPPPVAFYGRLSRGEFNQRAAEFFAPVFWREDENRNGLLEPGELAILWGIRNTESSKYLTPEGFGKDFENLYEQMVSPPPDLAKDAAEKARLEKVREELAQGRPTLVETDLRQADEEDRRVVKNILKAAELIERMHLRQKGVRGLEEKIPEGDLQSRMLFYRNQGPFCVAPRTEKDPDCNALASRPVPVSGLYPPALQKLPNFCETLRTFPNGEELAGHFSVVKEAVDSANAWEAVPYPVAYAEESRGVASALRAAADALKSPGEQAFKKYLLAAASAFIDNRWEKADEAWVKMSGSPSKWYLRIGPDEVYHEPCALKAGFHLSFARINPDSLAWQEKLAPVKKDMEKALAALAGPPYRARNVKFHLPDFIDIVLNAGDSRAPHGATIGQSLPNWGRVAEKGGRTVAMTNLYTDADSRQVLSQQMASLFCPQTFAKVSTDPKPALMSTVLHEAAHNLGPSHDYRVQGKVDDEVFGGPLASMMEELKAQTSALYFSEWLLERNILNREEAEAAHLRDVAWAFGHIAQGMYTGAGKPKPYSQLAAVQLGTLLDEKVLVWKAREKAANQEDVGCFEVALPKWKAAVDRLAARVLSAKGSGNRADAEAMKAAYVDSTTEWSTLRGVISQRWLRAPKASFVYSFRNESGSDNFR